MPRHKDRRFLAVEAGTIDADKTPIGGSTLPALRESANHSIEDDDIVVIAGEAEGHRSVTLSLGGAGWTAVVAADAWVAVGPRVSAPQLVHIGQHELEFPVLRFDPREMAPINEANIPTVAFNFKDAE
jgi:hypothetical protein